MFINSVCSGLCGMVLVVNFHLFILSVMCLCHYDEFMFLEVVMILKSISNLYYNSVLLRILLY